MALQDYLITRKRIDYTPLELTQLKEGIESGASLLELQALLSRPAHGIVKKLRMLALTDSQNWRREWFVNYRRELNNVDREGYLQRRSEYYQTHKEECLDYKKNWRAKRRKMGLRVT